MPLVPGLTPNIAIQTPEGQAMPDPTDIVIEHVEGADVPEVDPSGNILKIEHEDGAVTLSVDDNPLGNVYGEPKERDWYDNLVDDIDPAELGRISSDLLRGVDDDLQSRREWVEDRALGMRLLGLKVEVPSLQGASDGAPVEGMSKVRHPLLLEAVLRFQANARSELLPTDGPVKIRNDDNQATLETDQLANSLQRDLNHYLTAVATEYYPDTDRMLLMLGFGGTAFKKVYFCPLRNRPVSETVDADDLIVNNAATDLANAKRITHRIYMRPSVVKRMQILGVYKDVSLSTPSQPTLDSLQREEKSQQGLSPEASSPEDRDREIYECYCELDIKGFEHTHKGKVTGLEIPYRVTIDVTTKEILSIVRNYREDDAVLPEARKVFTKYTFVPGVGFYDIGLLHILGNTTNAITAAWRELLDAGMYSNFPGFLMADTGARQNTNIFRVPPGGGALVKTGGLPINQAIMPLPYQPPSQALMMLVSNMAETGQRIGGTSEQQVGEGKIDAPVGTTLAVIEQATKVMNAVHKRLHAAQAEEFRLLCDVFRDHPESFWQRGCRTNTQWDEYTFNKALDNCELVPQADPNTSSAAQRMMKVMALKELAAANPSMYDPIAIDTAALQAMGWSNPSQFFAPPSAQAKPPPELQKAMADIQIKKQEADAKSKEADARAQEAQARVAETQAKIQQGAFAPKGAALGAGAPGGDPSQMMEMQMKQADFNLKQQEMATRSQQHQVDDRNRDLDRQSRERIALLQLARDVMLHPGEAQAAQPELGPLERSLGTIQQQ
jgi:hypothetical protein